MPTVLITGAASGIGRASALRFAADGWRCVLVDRDADGLQRLQATLGDAATCRAIDLTDAAQIATLSTLPGPIDAVVNNAGMSDPSGTLLSAQPAQQQARLAALNLHAPAAVVAAVNARLVRGARIVDLASGAGLRAIPFRGWYSATKAGLIAQSQAFARARPDLVVTVLCPGFVRTELVDGLIAAGRLDPRQAVGKTPLGRMADPAEMAETIRFLASPAAASIAGAVLSLCGGSSVYGGSAACAPATREPLPLDTPLALSVDGDDAAHWLSADTPPAASHSGAHYPGVVAAHTHAWGDGATPEAAALIDRVHDAARRFAARFDHDASLTLLLPGDDTVAHGDWARAGALAAARMLVATLACELAPRALRINALQLRAGTMPAAVLPLLQHIAGARAQYLTGQTLPLAEARA